MSRPHSEPVEISILGELTLRRDGIVVPVPPPSLAETLIILALLSRPVKARELRGALARRPNDESLQQYLSKLKLAHELPILSTGPRGNREYSLDPRQCWVDSSEFVRGVDEGQPIDGLLQLWRGTLSPQILDTPPWSIVKQARARLIQRIAELPDREQAALTELGRFTGLFPGDAAVDAIRPHGPGSRPRLLVVEDDPTMMKEVCDRLETAYRLTRVTSIEGWRSLRRQPGQLAEIDGALVDLHLTTSLNDRRGVEIVKYLRDHTSIPAALVTANGLERSGYLHQRRMAEFRLVDIVDKKNDDWWEALETAARLLVGHGDQERRRRLETWLETAYLNLKRETEGAVSGSLAASRRQRCDNDYVRVMGLVRVGDIEAAGKEVGQFCVTWRASS